MSKPSRGVVCLFQQIVPALILSGVHAPALAQSDEPPEIKSPPPAEAVQRELEIDREPPTPLPPAGRSTDEVEHLAGASEGSAGPAVRLFPEDSPVGEAEGTLQRVDQRWSFVVERAGLDGLPPLPVLPNSMLERMESYALGSGKKVMFSISGVLTEYRDQNYILVRDVAVIRSSSRPATEPSGPAAGEQGSVDELMNAMDGSARRAESLPPQEGVPTSQPANQFQSVAPSQAGRAVWPEDTRLIGRVGRLLREGGWWSFAFESSGDRPAESAVRLLPNLALQQMETMSSGGQRRMLFKVSGDITAYSGSNYLLVRQFTVKPRGSL